MHENLIKYIVRKEWWHVTPIDPNAYCLRGKFYSSTFREAEFYGRPGDPERVRITNPVVGDAFSIEETLLDKYYSDALDNLSGEKLFKAIFARDAKIKKAAVKRGYDAIVVMSKPGYANYISIGKIPRCMELNVFI